MTAFVTDTFTDTNGTNITSHTGETGATWTKHASATNTGHPQISSNQLITTETAVNETYYASGTSVGADYTVSLDYTFNNSENNEICGPGGRLSTSASTGYFFIYFKNVNQARLYKYVSGTLTQIGSGVSFTPTNGATYKLTLGLSGNSITGKLQRLSDSQFLQSGGTFSASEANCVSVTDSSITSAGRAGFWFSGNPGAGGRGTLDNFSADEVINSAPSWSGTPSAMSAKRGQALTPQDITSLVSDADLDTLSYSITGAPTGVTINSSTGVISGTPTAAPGVYACTVEADDGIASPVSSSSFNITVTQCVLALNSAGYEFGDGNGPATMSVVASTELQVAAYPLTEWPPASAVATATATTGTNGRLADLGDDDLSFGTTYRVIARNAADGETWAWTMAAS